MANTDEVELAKRLLSHRIVQEEGLRRAFALQEQLIEQGKQVRLERVLYHLKLLPRDSLIGWRGPSPVESQPFPGYVLDGKLGEGGSSVVYGGTYQENGAPVAVKVLDPVQALRADYLARFQREARQLIRLEHENVVLGYELGAAAGLHYFSMEQIDGDVVYHVIERRGFLTNEEALSVTLQTARGLGYLHEQGFLHRDIKPSNIMVEPLGRAVMIDLGLIRAMDDGAGDTDSEEMTVGTVEYLSPEQARGRPDLDPRSDIYSLGVSLYHMVVGDVPFSGESDYEVMAKQVLAAMDTQKVKQRRISPEVQFFITKMMTKDRKHRYEEMSEVVSELAGYVPDPVSIDLGLEPPTPDAPPPAPKRTRVPYSSGMKAPVPRRKRRK